MAEPMAHWFIHHEHGSSPIERAVLGDCELSVLYLGRGEWQWLVGKDGRDVAGARVRSAADARALAEAVARSAGSNLS